MDWWLIYRERDELLELAKKSAPDAALELVEEPHGVNPFVALTK